MKSKFDIIILSPGININQCRLKKFLKNDKIIYTDLDIFYSFYSISVLLLQEQMGSPQPANY